MSIPLIPLDTAIALVAIALILVGAWMVANPSEH